MNDHLNPQYPGQTDARNVDVDTEHRFYSRRAAAEGDSFDENDNGGARSRKQQPDADPVWREFDRFARENCRGAQDAPEGMPAQTPAEETGIKNRQSRLVANWLETPDAPFPLNDAFELAAAQSRPRKRQRAEDDAATARQTAAPAAAALLQDLYRVYAAFMPAWQEAETLADLADFDPEFARQLAQARARRARLRGGLLRLAFFAEDYSLTLALLTADGQASASYPAAPAGLEPGGPPFAEQGEATETAPARFYPLHAAAAADDLPFAELYLAFGCPSAAKDAEGRTPLACAGSSRMIRLLRQNDGPLNEDLYQLLCRAMAGRNIALASWCAAQGALAELGQAGETLSCKTAQAALEAATAAGFCCGLALLLDAGLVFEKSDKDEWTRAAAAALQCDSASLLRRLLDAAGPGLYSSVIWSDFATGAVEADAPEILSLLATLNPKMFRIEASPLLTLAAMTDNSAAGFFLLCSTSSKRPQPRALLEAARNGNAALVSALLAAGAAPDAKDESGATAAELLEGAALHADETDARALRRLAELARRKAAES